MNLFVNVTRFRYVQISIQCVRERVERIKIKDKSERERKKERERDIVYLFLR